MQLQNSSNNRSSLKSSTFILNVVLLYYLSFFISSASPASKLPFNPLPEARSKTQSEQSQHRHNSNHHRQSHNNHTNNDHKLLTNQESFLDWFVGREVAAVMHETAIDISSESTYEETGEVCSSEQIESEGVYKKLDEVIVNFADVALRENDKVAENLQEGLAKAINLDEIVQQQPVNATDGQETEPVYQSPIRPSRGLLDILDEIGPNIVHRKVLSNKAIKELIDFTNSQPKYSDKVILSKMFAHVLKKALPKSALPEEKEVETRAMKRHSRFQKVKKIAKFVGAAVSIAVVVFEELYMSPNFLEHLPVIGAGIRKLKKFGQSPYDIIQAVRSVHQFLNHYREAPGSDPILKMSHIFTNNNQMMFSQQGLDSLSRIAVKLIERKDKGPNMTSRAKEEVAGRSAFYFLINLAKNLNGCKVKRIRH